MNTYEKIKALAPEGEAFDATAVNEGVWLTENHLANIETSLLNADTLHLQTQTLLDAEKQTVATAQASLQTANETITAKDAEIVLLKDEVAALKAKPAGSFTETAKDKDEHGGGVQEVLSEITKEANDKRIAMGKAPIK